VWGEKGKYLGFQTGVVVKGCVEEDSAWRAMVMVRAEFLDDKASGPIHLGPLDSRGRLSPHEFGTTVRGNGQERLFHRLTAEGRGV
jgi:hypothetical protein